MWSSIEKSYDVSWDYAEVFLNKGKRILSKIKTVKVREFRQA